MAAKQSRSRQAIKNAFLELLDTTPFGSITIQNILDKSNYSRGTFYAHFTDKQDLLDQAIMDEIDAWAEYATGYEQEYKRSYKEHEISEKEIEELSNAIFACSIRYYQHVYDNRKLYELLYHNKLPGMTPDDFAHKLYLRFRDVFRLTPAKNYSKLDVDIFCYVYSFDFVSYISYWVRNEFSYSPKYIAEQAFMLVKSNLPIFSFLLVE